MMTRQAWKTSAVLAMLASASCVATPHLRALEEVGSLGGNATVDSPESARAEGPFVYARIETPPRLEAVPSRPAPNADRGAAFLRAHVERRMRHLADHHSAGVAEAILAASRRSGIDPLLLLAIIEVESSFDPLARSNRNALGLMQVKPSTLWREAERSGLVGENPHDPDLNMAAGALYFRRLVDAFGPNDVALMAYNAGPNRILGLIRAGRIPDSILEYPRRVRAAEVRLRRALAVDSAGAALARNDLDLVNVRLE
jgi:hypothetical protein